MVKFVCGILTNKAIKLPKSTLSQNLRETVLDTEEKTREVRREMMRELFLTMGKY